MVRLITRQLKRELWGVKAGLKVPLAELYYDIGHLDKYNPLVKAYESKVAYSDNSRSNRQVCTIWIYMRKVRGTLGMHDVWI